MRAVLQIASAVLAAVALAPALATRGASSGFWLAVAAFACFAGMQAIFWIVVQPINKRWQTPP